ncbi:MAG: CHASE3 domain-containing protein [Acidobacteriaceae bacterium]
MGKTLKGLLLIGVPALLILIVLNGYLASKDLAWVRAAAAQRTAGSQLHADIAQLMIDVGEIQSGQQGYLLTADPSYLDPYKAASGRLQQDFANLRTRLADGPQEERDQEARVEELMRAKLAEAEQTIRWRQQGYRPRAFVMVGSGQGKGYTDQVRKELDAFAASASAYFAGYDHEIQASLDRASRVSLLANLVLFLVALLLYLALLGSMHRLEREAAEATGAWREAKGKLEQFRAVVAHDLRGMLGGIQEYAERLLQGYGDFLPRQGQEYAKRMKEMAAEMNGAVEGVLKEGEE